MRATYDNDWQDRTSVGHLRALVGIYETRHGSNEYPTSKEECIQMLFDRVHLYAECGYTSYTHGWERNNLPTNFLLEEVRDLAREVFLDCSITLTTRDITSCCSSSSTPEVIDRVYDLTISWDVEASTETSTNQEAPAETSSDEEDPSDEEKWNDSEDRTEDYQREDGYDRV